MTLRKKLHPINGCLDKGPCNLPLIPLLLCSFRLSPIAVLADLEKAFLQVRINEEDRDALLFLWFSNVATKSREIKIFRYTSLVFGLSCSPAVLETVLKLHFKKKY